MNLIKGWLADAEKSPDTRHVDTCDGVRALAICIVAWYHIWQQSWLYPNLTVFGREISFDPLVRSGYIWVDMMILISGFCLYLPWARLCEGEKGQSPAAFYEKRLARVHPSYLLTIAVMLGVALATRAYGDNRSFMLRDVASHLTYTQMFAYDTYYATNLGGSLWTLALEMQLYLIFPLLARAFRRQPAATFAAMMGIALATRGYIAATYPDVSLYFNQLPAYLGYVRAGHGGGARACAPLAGEARRGDAPCVQRGDGCGALAALAHGQGAGGLRDDGGHSAGADEPQTGDGAAGGNAAGGQRQRRLGCAAYPI